MPSRAAKSVSEDYIGEEQIRHALSLMEQDGAFWTDPSYSANAALYPNHLIPFAEKHIAYLKKNPQLNPLHYLANLRLVTKIKLQ